MSDQELLFGEQEPDPLHFQISIWVDRDTSALIEKPVRGEGGFQGLMRSLGSNLNSLRMSDGTRRLDLTPTQVDRIIRYARANKGSGGFQGRLARLLSTLEHIRGALDTEEP